MSDDESSLSDGEAPTFFDEEAAQAEAIRLIEQELGKVGKEEEEKSAAYPFQGSYERLPISSACSLVNAALKIRNVEFAVRQKSQWAKIDSGYVDRKLKRLLRDETVCKKLLTDLMRVSPDQYEAFRELQAEHEEVLTFWKNSADKLLVAFDADQFYALPEVRNASNESRLARLLGQEKASLYI